MLIIAYVTVPFVDYFEILTTEIKVFFFFFYICT